MKVGGRCHCGEIRYTAEVDADKVNGTPKIYIKTAESGNPGSRTSAA